MAEADALIADFMGEYVTEFVVPAIEQSDVYAKLTREGKKDFLKRVMEEYRSDIMDLVEYNAKQPVYKERYGFDPMEKAGWRKVPKVDRERAMQMYHDLHGMPEDGKYDFTKLLYYSKYLTKLRKAGAFESPQSSLDGIPVTKSQLLVEGVVFQMWLLQDRTMYPYLTLSIIAVVRTQHVAFRLFRTGRCTVFYLFNDGSYLRIQGCVDFRPTGWDS